MNDLKLLEQLIFFENNTLIDLHNEELINKIKDNFDKSEFIKNINFLESNNLVIENNDRDSIYFITEKGKKVLKRLISEQKIREGKEKLQYENLQYNTDVNKWLIKTKWYPLLLSVIAIFVSIFISINESLKNNKLEQRLKILEKKSISVENDAKLLRNYPTEQVEKDTTKKTVD